jgi:DNA-binding transcriptional LysR family regulator
MLLAHVESFLEVVRTGSLTRAAEALFVTQPTLTERLKSLESEVGKPLFFRTRRYGLQLTAAGEAFLPHAERIVQSAQEGLTAIAQAGTDASAGLILAVAPIVGTAVLGPALKRYRAANRQSSIDVRTGQPADVVKMVLDRSVDLGLGRLVRHPQIEVSPLYTEEIVPVVSPSHALAQVASARLRDIAGEQLIIVAKTVTYEHITRAIAKGGGTSPKAPVQVDSVEMARMLVERGVGVAFLPLGSAYDDLRRARLRRIRIADMAPIHARIVSLRRFDSPPEPKSIEDFVMFLREAGAALEGTSDADDSPEEISPPRSSAPHRAPHR